ncbi:MAG TPA: hypothetical protein VHT34_09685 [Clostridia bacterium]|nr:hypothetical protein [Clostridia bacterium]
MEEILNQILKEIKDIKGTTEKLEAGQAKLEAGQEKLEAGLNKLEVGQAKLEARLNKLEAGHKKLSKEVSDIKTLLTKGAYVDIQKLEKRIEVLEKKVV